MDPLSSVLSLLRLRSHLSASLDAGGAWAVRFPSHDGALKCGVLVAGACWLAVEGEGEPIRLEAGDCFLLPRGRPFRLTSDLRLRPQEAEDVLVAAKDGIAPVGQGGDVFLASSRFVLDGPQAGLLLDLLPPVVHVRGADGEAALAWAIERMGVELRRSRPGGSLVAEHLAHLVLIEALRQHLAERPPGGSGWLYALADPRLGAGLAAIHADPARDWSVQGLARLAGMSRSTFALRFREAVGEPPMDYLARWRMAMAADLLARTGEPVSRIARSVGYGSEAAFSTAFKRVMGLPPTRHRTPRGVRRTDSATDPRGSRPVA